MTHQENPHAGQGSVLLDIGGDIGALVVTMPLAMLGEEIEIAPVGGHPYGQERHGHGHDDGHGADHRHGRAHGHDHAHVHDRAHVAVVARPVSGGTVPSLVFPDLVEGSYELFDKGADQALLTAAVTGGRVTFLDWPAST
jgi:hypothetical protein